MRKAHKTTQGGWATLELIVLLPFFAALIYVLVFVGQAIFLQLQLGYLSQTAAKRAAQSYNPDCGAAQTLISNTLKRSDIQIGCESDEYTVTVTLTYPYALISPVMAPLNKDIHASGVAARIQKSTPLDF